MIEPAERCVTDKGCLPSKPRRDLSHASVASPICTYLSVLESPVASPDPRRRWCFRTSSAAQVDAFYDAGLAAGGKGDEEPGIRDYHAGYYAAFLADPEGNRIEAVFHHGRS